MSASANEAWPIGTRHLRIADVTIDLRYQRIRRPDGVIELQQRMFQLLMVFAAEPHVVHARGELLHRAWPGVIVEDANLSQAVWLLRKALGDERKDWIRTVAKQGYVFDPPAAVEAVSATQATIEATSNADTCIVAVEPRGEYRQRWWPYLAGAVVFAAAVTTAAVWHRVMPVAAPGPVAVALIEAGDPESATTARMPAALLHAWLEWKLSALPEITVLTQAHLAANVPTPGPLVSVLLVSGTVADDPSQVFLQARFEDHDGAHRIQAQGTPAEIGMLVDTVSRRVMHALTPKRARQPWPALQVDSAAALRYLDLLQARQTRDWVRVVELGEPLVQQAPQFVLAHLHLAQALATLGQLPAAQAQMQVARPLLQPLPPDVMAVIDAQALALSPRHEAAAAAFAKLSSEYPQQPGFALQYARALGRTGRFADALAVLSRPVFRQAQPLSIQLALLTNRSALAFSLGDPVAARASAEQADRLARGAGEGWDYERGRTLLVLAQADVSAAKGTRSSPFFEQSAQHFDRAGDRFSAVHARFLGETAAPGDDIPAHLDALLAQTRAAGQRQMELDALRSVAFHHYRAGDIPRYRVRLQQAAAVADAMDDNWGHAALGLDLLNEDFARGDLAGVDRRLVQLRGRGMQGDLASWMDDFAALAAIDRGRYPEALAALAHGQAQAEAQRATRNTAIVLECARAALALSQGQPEQARAHYTRCAVADPISAMNARTGIAEIDLLSGDRDTALAALREAQASLSTITMMPARWGLGLDIAAQLTRAGDTDTAAKLYAQIVPPLQASGFGRMEAFAYVGMAENAMARGEVDGAAMHADAARRLLTPDNWSPRYRLTLVDIAIARARGAPATQSMLDALGRDAHRRGDLVAQLLAYSLMSPSSDGVERERTALVARSGLRGATMDWLTPPRLLGTRENVVYARH